MVIFITKTTQILEILYPDAIPTSNFEFVATVVLPDIQKLSIVPSVHNPDIFSQSYVDVLHHFPHQQHHN